MNHDQRQNPRRRGSLSLALNVGSLLFPLATFAFGLEHLIFAGAADKGMYPWVLGPPAWNYAFGALLITVSVSIGIKKRAPLAARALGTILCLYALLLYIPRMVSGFHDPEPWTNVFGLGSPLSAIAELLAMSGTAWVLARGRIEGLGRMAFASTLVVFGLQHFLYRGFLATLIPSWIPWHLFWEYVVGAAFIAAAAGIATDRAARLAALLLGTMFLLFVLVLHLPRVVTAVRSRDEWTSALVAVAMSGGALVLAEASSRRSRHQEELRRPG